MPGRPAQRPLRALQAQAPQACLGARSLEYDPAFARLVSMLQPRGDAQYGEFIDSSEPPDWTEIERLCRELLTRIRGARQWFEANEPSSPVAVLLKQAERMVGQRFAQVADAIPLELVRKWDAEADRETST